MDGTHSTYLYSNIGTGVRINAIKPNTVFPQPMPSFAYSGGPAIGRKAPDIETAVLVVATADAEYVENASIRYVWHGMKIPSIPNPKTTELTIGTALLIW